MRGGDDASYAATTSARVDSHHQHEFQPPSLHDITATDTDIAHCEAFLVRAVKAAQNAGSAVYNGELTSAGPDNLMLIDDGLHQRKRPSCPPR